MRRYARFLAPVPLSFALVLVVFSTSAAHAEVSDSVDQSIVDLALENLGAEPVTDELAAELVSGIDTATDSGVIDQGLIDSLIDGDGAAKEDAAAALDAHLESDQELWDQISPAWIQAFEGIRADFEACRDGGSDTSVCARTLGMSLQIAHAEALLSALDARTAEVANLPEAEQAAALAGIESERAAIEARLLRSQERLAQLLAQGSATQTTQRQEAHAAELSAVLAKVRARALGAPGVDQADVATQSSPGDAGTQPTSPAARTNAPGSATSSGSSSGTVAGKSSTEGSTRGKPDSAGKSGNAGSGQSESR